LPVRRFSKSVIAALDEGQILGVRAGTAPHHFLGVWVVVAAGRVFIRPWNDKPHGWYRVFLEEPRGTIQIPGGRELSVRARHVQSERVLAAVDAGYATKYHTPGSRVWVRGLVNAPRRAKTIELTPR
jgi:hypothetical protein